MWPANLASECRKRLSAAGAPSTPKNWPNPLPQARRVRAGLDREGRIMDLAGRGRTAGRRRGHQRREHCQGASSACRPSCATGMPKFPNGRRLDGGGRRCARCLCPPTAGPGERHCPAGDPDEAFDVAVTPGGVFDHLQYVAGGTGNFRSKEICKIRSVLLAAQANIAITPTPRCLSREVRQSGRRRGTAALRGGRGAIWARRLVPRWGRLERSAQISVEELDDIRE